MNRPAKTFADLRQLLTAGALDSADRYLERAAANLAETLAIADRAAARQYQTGVSQKVA